jgi:predicted thioesterase
VTRTNPVAQWLTKMADPALAVTGGNTALALGSGDVPVFATPALVALLEQAAVHALGGRLSAGETSVGTAIEIVHLAATPMGEVVRGEAELTRVEGRTLHFSLAAFDGRQKVGEGRHTRVIVLRDRFLAKLR